MFVTARFASVIVGTWVGWCFLFAIAGNKRLWKVDVSTLYIHFGLCFLLFFNTRVNFSYCLNYKCRCICDALIGHKGISRSEPKIIQRRYFLSFFFCQITVLCKNFKADPQKNVALESQMDLEYFTRLRHGPVSSVIRWLQLRSLLANPLHCGACNRDI